MSGSGGACGCPGSMSDVAGNAPSLLIERTSSSHPFFNEESLRMTGTQNDREEWTSYLAQQRRGPETEGHLAGAELEARVSLLLAAERGLTFSGRGSP